MDKTEVFNEVHQLINNYNKELPRKPGRMEEIKNFIIEKNLITKLKLFM